MTNKDVLLSNEEKMDSLSLQRAASSSLSLASIPPQTRGLVLRMFSDPNLLEKQERSELVAELRECVALNPEISELRVLLGMALCVNLEVHPAMEELQTAVALHPGSFIAHLKMGELWMRLRVCSKAQDHTLQAAKLAQNMAQADLARRQAATIRTMLREGIERGGYKTPGQWIAKQFRRLVRNRTEALATPHTSSPHIS
jgi:hypothetical protein